MKLITGNSVEFMYKNKANTTSNEFIRPKIHGVNYLSPLNKAISIIIYVPIKRT